MHDKPADPDESALSEQYRMIFDGVLDGIVIIDAATGRIEDANPAARRMLGYGLDERIEATVYDHVPAEDLDHDPVRIDRVVDAGRYSHERRLRRKDGSVLLAELRSHVLAGGRIVTVARDLTERIEREAALRRSEDQYRRMIERSPDAIFVHAGGVYVYVNPAATRLVGATSEAEIVGQSALSIGLLQESLQDLPMTTRKFAQIDGTVIDIELTAFPIEWQGQAAVQVIVREITDRVRHEQALRSSEERYRGLVEDASEAIFRLGPDGQILSANPASTRMTGWSEEELLAMDFRTIVHPDDLARGQETVRATLAGTRGKAVFRLFRKDGSIAYVDTTTVPERQNGQVAAVFGIGRDISATRAANDRL
ncbi:MAG TPA: PAS domain S-box protein, partial [Thermoanaerobaculia bacterium]